jgi:hypothetical protein
VGRRMVPVLIGAMALTGCGSPWEMSEEEAVEHIRAEQRSTVLLGTSDEGLGDLMRETCAVLDGGDSPSDMIFGPIESLQYPEAQVRDLALVIGTAVLTYCPRHRDELRDRPGALGGYRSD